MVLVLQGTQVQEIIVNRIQEPSLRLRRTVPVRRTTVVQETTAWRTREQNMPFQKMVLAHQGIQVQGTTVSSTEKSMF